MVMHVDDLFVFAAYAVREIRSLQKHIKTDEPEKIDDGALHAYCGLSVRMSGGELLWDQGQYVQNICAGIEEKGERLTDRDFADIAEGEIDPSLQTEHQEKVGKLGWMVKSQPHLSFLFSALSRHNTKPSRKSLRAVDKALCYAKSTVRPLRLHSLKKGERPVLLGWVDASYDRDKKEGRKGMEFQLVGESALAGDITQLDYDNTVM
uniref:Reverse transcriptase Ty1/copia-type domain-containing protein n=1 Tax=Chromera velia CCMP2878 TaxID=1169474 RepID=A0A0G4GJ40_9ALVE|eukprot:Cvel_22114.t1-p1 / transcript=Cvel_22114.t1 / gene=Cvel_22114 / organism=Chromera_velia_CCMP2878 / gene_product=hypothetical protein / transcript_product=hypothetical protein / location=Cvel_scaffold2142:7802-8419(+) / protein_length=206 / sequence_SO=supercontig / SO=protein_coding / is_pseudo=false